MVFGSVRSSDRILLHLARYYGHAIDVVAPWAMTQDGIAAGIMAERKNIAMPLKTLTESGRLAVHKRHIKGARTIRKIYALTPKGKSEAEEISKVVGEASIDVMDLGGNHRQSRIRDVPTFVTTHVDMLDVILAVKDGGLDCRQLQQRGVRSERKLVDMTERMPVVKGFFGRSEEIGELHAAVENPPTKAIVVSGIPGIGKTTLVAAFLKDWKKEHDVFWLRIHEWTGLRGLLIAFGEFLSAQGKPALLSAVGSGDSLDLERFGIILRSDVAKAKGIVVIDDFHKGDERMREAVKVIFQILIEEDAKLKMIVIGRSTSAFLDERNLKIEKSVAAVLLDELDPVSCRQLLAHRGIPERYHEGAMAMSKGHPLCLQLFEPSSGEARPAEFYDFLEREISTSLSPTERGVLTASAIARYPLSPDAFSSPEIAYGTGSDHPSLLQIESDVHRALVSLKERNLVFEAAYGTIDLHDLIKDFFRTKASKKLTKGMHSALSQYYIDGDSSFSANEAIYHLVSAEDLDSAFEIAKTYCGEILSRVGHFTLDTFIEASGRLDALYLRDPEFMLLKAKVEEMGGSIDFALKTLDMAVASDRTVGDAVIAEIKELQGNILVRRGELQKAQESLVDGKDIAKKLGDIRLQSSISCDLGNLFHRQGMLGEARENFDAALKGAEETGDDVLRGRSLYGIAKIVAAEECYDEAISIEQKALGILIQTGALSDQAKILASMGVNLDAIGRSEEAKKCQEEAYNLSVKAGDVYTQGHSLMNLASILLKLGSIDDSKRRVVQAKDLASRMGDVPMLSFLSMLEGKIAAESNDWKVAEAGFTRCIELGGKSGQKYYLANWHISIGNFYATHGKRDEALSHLRAAKEICESYCLKDLSEYIAQRLLAIDENK